MSISSHTKKEIEECPVHMEHLGEKKHMECPPPLIRFQTAFQCKLQGKHKTKEQKLPLLPVEKEFGVGDSTRTVVQPLSGF